MTGAPRVRQLELGAAGLLLRPRVAVLVPRGRADQLGAAGAAGLAAGPARRAVQDPRPRARGPTPTSARRASRRSSGARANAACRPFAGRTRGPGTCCSRCERRPTRPRSAVRWPSRWPPFARRSPRGRDLSDPDNVLLAAAACELHPRALLTAVETRAVKDALRAATDEAAERGVIGVPTRGGRGRASSGATTGSRRRCGAAGLSSEHHDRAALTARAGLAVM